MKTETKTELRQELKATRAAVSHAMNMSERLLIVMQAALIESQIGRGPAYAMRWIWNALDGPGLVPDFDEVEKLGGAQAFFDRSMGELEGNSAPPSNPSSKASETS